MTQLTITLQRLKEEGACDSLDLFTENNPEMLENWDLEIPLARAPLSNSLSDCLWALQACKPAPYCREFIVEVLALMDSRLEEPARYGGYWELSDLLHDEHAATSGLWNVVDDLITWGRPKHLPWETLLTPIFIKHFCQE